MSRTYRFDTIAIHAGQPNDALTGSVTTPIYQTTTFAQDELAIEGETKETLPDRTVFLGGNGVLVGNLELRIPIDAVAS